MSKKRPLTDEERGELVAFLDGELTGDAKRAVEARISLDPVWRAEADSLRRAWDLLDFLPRPEPSPSFTERTLSRLEPIRKASAGGMGHPGRRGTVGWWLLAGSWAAAVLLALGGGFFTYRATHPHRPGELELARDLRLIENKRFYDAIDDFEFLSQLADPDLFGEEGTGG